MFNECWLNNKKIAFHLDLFINRFVSATELQDDWGQGPGLNHSFAYDDVIHVTVLKWMRIAKFKYLLSTVKDMQPESYQGTPET